MPTVPFDPRSTIPRGPQPTTQQLLMALATMKDLGRLNPAAPPENELESARRSLEDQDVGGGTGKDPLIGKEHSKFKRGLEQDEYITKRGEQDI